MTCRKCGYRNDFLKECPFHEPTVAERIQTIRERKRKEELSEGAKNTEQANQPDSGE
jgi:hypothetical protein